MAFYVQPLRTTMGVDRRASARRRPAAIPRLRRCERCRHDLRHSGRDAQARASDCEHYDRLGAPSWQWRDALSLRRKAAVWAAIHGWWADGTWRVTCGRDAHQPDTASTAAITRYLHNTAAASGSYVRRRPYLHRRVHARVGVALPAVTAVGYHWRCTYQCSCRCVPCRMCRCELPWRCIIITTTTTTAACCYSHSRLQWPQPAADTHWCMRSAGILLTKQRDRQQSPGRLFGLARCAVLLRAVFHLLLLRPLLPDCLLLHGSGGNSMNHFWRTRDIIHTTGSSQQPLIGIFPQGAGNVWNTAGQSNVDDMAFILAIVTRLRVMGATGRLYAFGSSNGAALAQRIGTNGGMGFTGIIPSATQLSSSPERSGPSPHDYNYPTVGSSTRAIAVLMLHGSADTTIPVGGGRLFFTSTYLSQQLRVYSYGLMWADARVAYSKQHECDLRWWCQYHTTTATLTAFNCPYTSGGICRDEMRGAWRCGVNQWNRYDAIRGGLCTWGRECM